jgi:hypothetical protein
LFVQHFFGFRLAPGVLDEFTLGTELADGWSKVLLVD